MKHMQPIALETIVLELISNTNNPLPFSARCGLSPLPFLAYTPMEQLAFRILSCTLLNFALI